jgi:hypothetical protein
MDPAKCLQQAEAHCRAGEWTETLAALADYWTWRRNGGFEPVGGDALARSLAHQVRNTLRQQRGEQLDGDGEPRSLKQCLDELWAKRDWSPPPRE